MVPTTTDYNVGVLKTACDAQWNKNGERSCNMYVSKQFDKSLHIFLRNDVIRRVI